MNFPRFWARGGSGSFSCWRWSDQSVAEAQSRAEEAARQLEERFRAGQRPPTHGGYYPDRPFREEVLREINDASGAVTAVITRNSYGCQVLNTARVMFVDIDLPERKPSGGIFKRLFGKPDAAPPANPQDEAMARVESWTRHHPEWGWRIYRTRAGLRLLATQDLVDADSAAALEIFSALGADPLYQRLCKTQKCYRARLTPKPWRCGIKSKPERWPWLDAKVKMKFEKWEREYVASAAEWATCELVRQIGNGAIHPGVEPIIKIHDEAARAESKLELA